MRLVDDPEIAEWVEALTGAEAFEWDRGNRTKSEVKHGFSVADVESIFASPVLFAGRNVEPASSEALPPARRHRGRPIRCGRVHPARREATPDQLPRDAAQGEGDVRCSEVRRVPCPGP
jgi:hypothetical protein